MAAQQKSLSGRWERPKGRITTSNPSLLGGSSSGGTGAEKRRSRAHHAPARERDWTATAEHDDVDVGFYHSMNLWDSTSGLAR